MKKQIENFIVKCVCKGIEMYVSQHRFGFNGMLEMLPLTNEDFKKHLSKQLTEEAAKSYLETVPTIHPQDVQQIKQTFGGVKIGAGVDKKDVPPHLGHEGVAIIVYFLKKRLMQLQMYSL